MPFRSKTVRIVALYYCPKQLAKGLYEFIPGHLVIPGTPHSGHVSVTGKPERSHRGITGACHMTLNGLGGGAVMVHTVDSAPLTTKG